MVPNLESIAENLKDDIKKPLYESPSGPISALDMIYGCREFTRLGMKEMFHRMGFTPRLMGEVLQACNFKYKIYTYFNLYNLKDSIN